ncbi:MAG TPA: class I SAM-dependent methyltransferase [Verrucomicrobiae bacterium]
MSTTAFSSQDVARCCPVCASSERSEYLRKQDLRLVRCGSCSMVYASPVRREFVSGQYYDREASDYYLSPAKLESDYASVRFERELRLFREHCQRGKVLDVGCSSGAFLYQLSKRFPGCYATVGTDASGPALDYAEKRGLAVVRGDFLKQDFEGRRFEAVTFWAVLEHVADPGAFLKKASSLMKDEGICFALVPNLRSLATRLLGARYRYIYPQHLNYFTRATFMTLARKHFEVIHLRSTHFNPIVIWQDWRCGGAEVSNEKRAELLQQTTAYKQSGALRRLRALYQMTETMLGWFGLADNLVLVLRKKSQT